MESTESHQIQASLARQVERGVSAAHIADAVVSTWEEVERALTPIVGQQGVIALYRRSLHLTASTYFWLSGMHESMPSKIDRAALKDVLSQQSSSVAAAGGGALLQTFYELMVSLVGSSLTERLLRSAWAHCLCDPPPQDISP
jgi:hypothetical protein